MGILSRYRLDPDEEADAAGTGNEFEQLTVFGKAQAGLRAPAYAHIRHPFQDRPGLGGIPQKIVIQEYNEFSGKRADFGEDVGGFAVTEAISEILGNCAKSAIVRAAAAGLDGLGREVALAGQDLAARPGDIEPVVLRYRSAVYLGQPVAEKIF